MEYRRFDIEDFVKDDFFLRWVTLNDDVATAFWLSWLHDNPDKKEAVDEAIRIIRLIRLSSDSVANQQFLDTWKHLDQVWDTTAAEPLTKPAIATRAWYKMTAAAALLVLAFSIVYLINTQRNYTSLTSQYGEIRIVKLPDGSSVSLNGNSSLRYHKDFTTSTSREVWLEGEAFFSVEHRNDQKFIVHTPDGINVEVVGTTFNVFKRRGVTRVSLNTGKIKLKATDQYYTAEGRPLPAELIMKPGDVAEFNDADRKVVSTIADPVIYSSWKEKDLIFNNTSIEEVAAILEDVYGYRVIMEETFKPRRITGKFRSDDLTIFLKFLSKALDANVEKKDTRIIIHKIK
jgi:transmembrane sensor